MVARALVLATCLTLLIGFSSLPQKPAYSAYSASSNLLQGDGASFDGGTGGWSALSAGASLSSVSTPLQSGTGALAVTTNVQGPLDVWITSGSAETWTPAQPTKRYVARGYVRAVSQARRVAPIEIFFDGNGSYLETVWGKVAMDATNAWSLTSPVVGIAPASTAYVAFGLIFYGTGIHEVHLIDSASITAYTFSPKAIKAPFHTSGNHIYGSDGARVIFRGIHWEGSQLAYPRFPKDQEIAQARAWGANFIRVPVNEALWINTCSSKPTNRSTYPSAIDNEIRQITSRHMLALLDLHFNPAKPCTTSKQQKMADALYAPTFWAKVAARYKGNPWVAFDLYNEPMGISDAVWLNGGSVSYGSSSYKAAGMQQLYNAIRGQGATNLIFVSGNDYNPPSRRVSGKNIVYGIHVYTWDPGALLRKWATFAGTSPVMLTEFGDPNPYDGAYNWKVISDAQNRGWGWDAFAWDGGVRHTYGLLNSMGSTYEPSASGMPVVAGLLNN